jgi:hypothetical protein
MPAGFHARYLADTRKQKSNLQHCCFSTMRKSSGLASPARRGCPNNPARGRNGHSNRYQSSVNEAEPPGGCYCAYVRLAAGRNLVGFRIIETKLTGDFRIDAVRRKRSASRTPDRAASLLASRRSNQAASAGVRPKLRETCRAGGRSDPWVRRIEIRFEI